MGPTRSEIMNAKRKISLTFDTNGQTLEEEDIKEDGSSTKTITKTPSTLLEDQTFMSDDMSLEYQVGPAGDKSHLRDTTTDISHMSDAEIHEAADIGEQWKAALKDSIIAAGNKEHLKEMENDSIAVPPVVMSHGSPNGRGREHYIETPFYSFKDGKYISEDEYLGTGQADKWESDLINKRAVVDKHGTWGVIGDVDPVQNTTGVMSITDEDMFEAQNIEAINRNENYVLELKDRHPDKFVDIMNNEGVELPYRVPHDQSIFEEETEEVIEEATKETSGDTEDLVEDAIKFIKRENPEGITVLNDFATWADTVSDSQANLEAERYLQELKDSPSVDQRFRKAMAVGMMAMLFGDDFTTAMNTGFGVVADDYAAEAAAAKSEAEAAADLAKTVATEQRANAESDRRKLRDFTLEMEKLKFEKGVEEAKDKEAEVKARASNNQDWMSEQASHYESLLTDDQKNNIGAYNFEHQYDRALQTVKNLQPDVVWDLENNLDQRVAFNTQFEKWFADKTNPNNNFGKGVPAFANYMQDAFIKIRMEEDSPLAMKDTNPSVGELQNMGIDISSIDFKAGMESTKEAYTKIETMSQGFNERGTLALLAKDYYDWQKNDPDGHAGMVRRANEQGIGGFIYFVTRHVDSNSSIGTMYDPAAKGKDNEWRTDYAIQYLTKEGIVVTPKK